MFSTRLHTKMLQKNSRVCVGLDPRLEWLPQEIQTSSQKKYGPTFEAAGDAISTFNLQVLETIAPYVPAVKPQIAFYEQYGPAGLTAFLKTIQRAHELGLEVIVDAKRGDIDSTAQAYANSLLGKTPLFGTATPCYDVDCVTVNPFLGEDTLVPFVESCEAFGKGIFVLVKTSNPGSQDLQDLALNGKSISTHVAEMIAPHAARHLDSFGYSGIGAVVGATFPEEAKSLRKQLPHSIFLVPGVGPQGGSFQDLAPFFDSKGLGAVINSSRGIVFSRSGKEGTEYLSLIVEKTRELVSQVNTSLGLSS